jgi:hypothetical protein
MKTVLIVVCGLLVGTAIAGAITGKQLSLSTSFSFCLHADKECHND